MELQTRTIHYRCQCGSLIVVSARRATLSGDASTLQLDVQAEHEPGPGAAVPLLFPMSCRRSMQAARAAAEMQGLIAIDPKEIS